MGEVREMEVEQERESRGKYLSCELMDLFNCTEKRVIEQVKEEKRRLKEEMRVWEERRTKEEEEFRGRKRK